MYFMYLILFYFLLFGFSAFPSAWGLFNITFGEKGPLYFPKIQKKKKLSKNKQPIPAQVRKR